jgi:serine phosphatase RsbU (regulator of sigma subunit)
MPLISRGDLVGWLTLGKRLNDREYSADDWMLLNNLAVQAGPAVRLAQLVAEQQVMALEQERLDQELQVARIIQETLLPKEVPSVEGWQMNVYWRPARAVGGDFYDLFLLPDGRLVVVVGDVTDKGVPAAIVMASTRAILRGAARRLLSPREALERANELLHPEIPPHMFVTCLYAILDPSSGQLHYANAGHNLPFRACADGVEELYATGMPLGLLPGMRYEERETTIFPGECLVLYSDGLTEAHNPQREMFGSARLGALVHRYRSSGVQGTELIDFLLAELTNFAGNSWEQEDDVTLLSVERCV